MSSDLSIALIGLNNFSTYLACALSKLDFIDRLVLIDPYIVLEDDVRNPLNLIYRYSSLLYPKVYVLSSYIMELNPAINIEHYCVVPNVDLFKSISDIDLYIYISNGSLIDKLINVVLYMSSKPLVVYYDRLNTISYLNNTFTACLECTFKHLYNILSQSILCLDKLDYGCIFPLLNQVLNDISKYHKCGSIDYKIAYIRRDYRVEYLKALDRNIRCNICRGLVGLRDFKYPKEFEVYGSYCIRGLFKGVDLEVLTRSITKRYILLNRTEDIIVLGIDSGYIWINKYGDIVSWNVSYNILKDVINGILKIIS